MQLITMLDVLTVSKKLNFLGEVKFLLKFILSVSRFEFQGHNGTQKAMKDA